MSMHTWWLFVTATFLISGAPGPNMLLVMSQSVRFNRRSALLAGSGCLSSLIVMQAASAAGLGVLLLDAPVVFTLLRWAGVVYLVYLGYKVWCAPVSPEPEGASAGTRAGTDEPGAWVLYKTGVLTAASNPKALLFAVAFFPQFLNPESPQLPQFGILLSTFIVIETSWYLVYAAGGHTLSAYLKRTSVLKTFNRITGGTFVGFAALMASVKA